MEKQQNPAAPGGSEILRKTAEMMNEDQYWALVGRSIQSMGNPADRDTQERFLIGELAQLSPEEMIGFRLRTDKLLYDTYTSDLWCAGYIMNAGCSDDGFEYFRNWVISRGREVFYRAKENPDSLISEANEEQEE